jgi:hypothetical protein
MSTTITLAQANRNRPPGRKASKEPTITQMESAGAEVNVREPTGFFTNLQVKDWATLIIIAPS